MSSLRNAVKRRTHKERSQTSDRKKFGFLEKHQDYVVRARDYNKKKELIKNLRLKAAFKNPDEFNFGMIRAQTKDGVHQVVAEGSEGLSHDVATVLKTQDMAYLHMKHAVDVKKAERLRQSLHDLAETPGNRHTIFLDSEKEADRFDPAEYFGTAPELAGRAFNRPRRETLEKGGLLGASTRKELRKVMKGRETAYAELEQREERAKKLERARALLDTQRAVMNGKGTKRKVQPAKDGLPAVYKWKRQRTK